MDSVILKTAYPVDHISPLLPLLQSLCQYSHASVLADNDPPPYRLFVCSTTVATSRPISAIRKIPYVEPIGTLDEVVDAAISKIVKSSSSREQNALSLGYKNDHGRLVCQHPNTIVNYVKSPVWQTLLARIGQTAMLYLLTETSIFVALGSSCYLQVCGKLLFDVIPNYSSIPVENFPKWRDRSFPEKCVIQDQTPTSKDKGKQKAVSAQSQPKDDYETLQDSLASSIFTAFDSPNPAHTQFTQPPPQPQPHQIIKKQVQFSNPSSTLNSPFKNNATLLLRNNAATTTPPPQPTLRKPTQIVFQRNHIFYGRPIRSRRGKILSGVPKWHILQTPDADTASKLLLHQLFPVEFRQPSIFTDAQFGTTQSARQTLTTKTNASLLTIPKRLENVVSLLKHMHKLFSQCNTEALLEYYSPKPDEQRLKRFLESMTKKEEQKRRYLQGLVMVVEEKNQEEMEVDVNDDAMDGDDVVMRDAGEENTNTEEAPLFALANDDKEHENETEDDKVDEQPAPKPDDTTPLTYYDFNASYYQVSSFVKSVMNKVIPKAFWGSDHNKSLIYDYVDRFIRLRRNDKCSLHDAIQGLKVNDMTWTMDPELLEQQRNPQPTNKKKKPKTPATEFQTRTRLAQQFVYWLFDGFIMPLIKTTFYVTETVPHRHKVFYFRQDTWFRLTQPALESLGNTLFQKIEMNDAVNTLVNRQMGYSFVRLLPKENGVRPIMNLKRKTNQETIQSLLSTLNNKAKDKLTINVKVGHQPAPKKFQTYQSSINSILQHALQILTSEKLRDPTKLGASVFGNNDVYVKLKEFKTRVRKRFPQMELDGAKLSTYPQLYFAKVDITAAFDTIRQKKLFEVIKNVLQEDEYMIQRYALLYPSAGRVRREFVKKARPSGDYPQFQELASKLSETLSQAVLVDQVCYTYENVDDILALLDEHIFRNIVKIGKGFYQQVTGIPQGSTLSTLFCNFLYGDLELSKLSFAMNDDGVMFRWVDDFLYISLNKDNVIDFLKIMQRGHPEYGCFVNTSKSMVNFDLEIDGCKITNVVESPVCGYTKYDFPWCGLILNTRTLDATSDWSKYADMYISTSLRIDTTRNPGKVLRQKLMDVVKPKCLSILLDTSLNTRRTVLLNIFQNFKLTGIKLYAYLKEFKTIQLAFLKDLITKTIDFAYMLMISRVKSAVAVRNFCKFGITRAQVTWLGLKAFLSIFETKPTKYQELMAFLKTELSQVMKKLETKNGKNGRNSLAAITDPNLHKMFDKILY